MSFFSFFFFYRFLKDFFLGRGTFVRPQTYMGLNDGVWPREVSGQPKVTQQGTAELNVSSPLPPVPLSPARPPFSSGCAHRAPRGGHRCGWPAARSPQNEAGFVAVTPAAVAG